MLNWLRSIWQSVTGGISAVIQAFVHALVAGVCLVLDFIFGNVKSAWNELVTAAKDVATGAHILGSAVWNQLDKILTYYIPTFAMTAWWWVTNPDSLALVMLWHLLKWLEHYAWTAAQYLGEFAFALFLRNIKRFALLIETIITAVI